MPDGSAAHYSGHRDRLRQRFMDAGGNALADYELLEMLLFYTFPRGDTKPLAKDLIAQLKFVPFLEAPGVF